MAVGLAPTFPWFLFMATYQHQLLLEHVKLPHPTTDTRIYSYQPQSDSEVSEKVHE